jgi:hypothetical protein
MEYFGRLSDRHLAVEGEPLAPKGDGKPTAVAVILPNQV